MQALHASFGIGALIGPAFVGLFGYTASFQLLALLLCIAAAIVCLKYFFMKRVEASHNDSSETKGVELGDVKKTTEEIISNAANESNMRDGNCLEASKLDTAVIDRTIPIVVQVLGFLFFFIYVGIETGFGGWIPTFSLKTGVAKTESKAAYLTAVFYGSLAAGRIISVPVSIFFSSTSMIRGQLLISLVGGIVFFFFGSLAYTSIYLSCAILGAGLSGLFPLMLVLPVDYGFEM